MAKTVNKVFLLGNVGKDPEMMSTSGGTLIANFSIATSYKAKNRDEVTTWHNVTAFSRTAEIVRDYVRKSSKLFVEGRIDNQSWEKNGQKHYRSVVIVDQLTLLDGSSGNDYGRQAPNRKQQQPAYSQEISDIEIPF